MGRLRGFKNLVHDAVDVTTNLVERTHRSVTAKRTRLIATVPGAREPAERVEQIETLGAAGVYATIRAINRGIDRLTDAPAVIAEKVGTERALANRTSLTMEQREQLARVDGYVDLAQGALNGLIGDYLSERDNDLALGMSIRGPSGALTLEREALASALPNAAPRVVVFVHGLCCTDRAWNLYAEQYYGDPSVNFGSQLENDLGYTPLFVRYNTGRHISDNGQQLSQLIEALVAAYPIPVREIVLVGHSMGGLVARSAAHYAERHGASWPGRLAHVFCIASPNLGAPLEKATNVLASVLSYFDTPGTRVPAAILNARSAGIKDLRFGYVVEEEWAEKNPDRMLEDNRQHIPFLDHVGYYFLACTISRDTRHPAAGLIGDLLVRLPSAAGHHPEPARRVPFHFGRVFTGIHHLHVMNHPDVYEELRSILAAGSRESIAGLLEQHAADA